MKNMRRIHWIEPVAFADSRIDSCRQTRRRNLLTIGLAALMLAPARARASLFAGETLDTISDVLTWVVLVVAPVVGITVFLLIHILPEKIAEKKGHPQTKAIQCLCLLSLLFGGMLWPLAWLWAYTKPVLHKLAYGTDRAPHEPEEQPRPPAARDDTEELKQLRKRVTELETKLASKSIVE